MTFNDYLKDVHAKQYKGLDDDMYDDFLEWKSCLTDKEKYEHMEKFQRKEYDNNKTNREETL